MDTKNVLLVRDSLFLLRQVRAGLHSESHHSLALKIDEAITCLEEIEANEVTDTETIRCALNLLAKGLAAVPAIARLVELIRNS